MPYTPQFGGTNSVPELNVGQAGSTRRSDSKVVYFAKVALGALRTAEVEHGVPQADVVFVDRLGARAQTVTWTGRVWIQNDTQRAALESHLLQYRTGCTVDPDSGVRSAPNRAYLKGTILKDSAGMALASRAVMADFRFRGPYARLTSPAEYMYGNWLTIVFRILG